MKILVIGSDPRIFDTRTENFRRVRSYALVFEEFHIVSPAPVGTLPVRLGNFFLWPISSRLPLVWWWRMVHRARHIACQHRVDLVDAQDAGESGLAALLIARALKIPFRIQLHTDVLSPYYRRASWKERMRYLLARFLIPRASCLRVVSERIKTSLLQSEMVTDESRIVLLPIFTDVWAFLHASADPAIEARLREYDFKMIAVGRFVDKEKNFSMLIDVMRLFVRICPRALLVIVGDGPDRVNYELGMRKYGLEKNIIIEPWRNDLPSFYQSFDLFLGSSNYEGWGRAVIEAMAVGLAVVMTDTGLAGEFVKNQENGMVVPVGDARAFLEAIKILYQDTEKRKLLAAAGRETARNLTPATREEYLAHYRKSFELCFVSMRRPA